MQFKISYRGGGAERERATLLSRQDESFQERFQLKLSPQMQKATT